MLGKAFVLCTLFVLKINCDGYSDFSLGNPFAQSFSFDLVPEETRYRARDVEAVTDRDREPLSPDYREPKREERPLVKPKTQSPSFDPSIIPGGVIDVSAGGFPAFETHFSAGDHPRPGFPFSDGFPSDDEIGLPNFGRPGSLFSGLFSPLGDIKPWWKGSNVCVEREESTDDEETEVEPKKNETEEVEKVPNFFSTSISLSNCHETPNKYECITKINNHGVVKTFTVSYKCCYGYARSRDSAGCDRQIDLKPLLQTIEDVGAKEFKKMIVTYNLEKPFETENFTVFVPSDKALTEFNEKMSQLNDLDLTVDPVRRRRELRQAVSGNELLLNHITKGFVDILELVNDEIVHSKNNNGTIRINNYPTQNYDRLVTANCAKVTKANNLAKNGIVHMLDGVIVPATQSVQDILGEHRKLTSLKLMFENTDLFKKFKDDGHYTLFAPTDEAFEKLDPVVKQKILKGESCASSIIKYHVTPHTVCSAAIIGNSTTHNVEGEVLNIERTTEDKLILENKAKFVETDIIATNGVIHLIDTVIIPESALHINDALKKENLTIFQELIEKAGLVDEVDSFKNSTVFAPSNKAIEESKILEEIGDDMEKLKQFVMYHTVQGQLQTCDMNNNVLLKSNDRENSLRVNLYSTLPLFSNIVNRATVNCARLIGFDEKTCGSILHEVDKVLVPPSKNILDVVHADSKFSTFSEIIKGTEVEKILQEANNSITLLAPTDETFAGIGEDDLKSLKEDKEKANEVMKNHILTEVLCCSGVGPQTFGFNNVVPTLSHQSHQVGRTGNHQIRIGRAVVTNCDALATNGIVHTVNKVLFPRRSMTPNIGGYFFLDF